MALMYTESMSLFLVSIILYLLTKTFNTNKPKELAKYSLLAGFFIGYLVLTKIIFGYVLMVILIGVILLWLTKMKSVNYRKSCIIFLIALATTSPYLIYTYHLTGRPFYWGTSGGINLYWMSSPFEGEYGSWEYNPKYNSRIYLPHRATGGPLYERNKNNFIPGGEDSIIIHHQKDFEEIKKYVGVEEDDAYKKIAIKNIKSHPLKFLQNYICNIGRIIFNYPYSYTVQKPGTLIRFPMNGIIVVFLLFSLIPTFINWRRLGFSAKLVLFIVVLYLGGTVLGCAETRMFTPIVPMILFWIAYIMNKSIKVNLKFN
jgi:4-amino-4-deoxy-L-arabinose transferase-like glycosyltransferase